MIGVKFLDDEYLSNKYYAEVGGVSLADLNKMEGILLEKLEWRAHVSKTQIAEMMVKVQRGEGLGVGVGVGVGVRRGREGRGMKKKGGREGKEWEKRKEWEWEEKEKERDLEGEEKKERDQSSPRRTEEEAGAEDDLAAGEVTDGVADLSIPSIDDRGKE